MLSAATATGSGGADALLRNALWDGENALLQIDVNNVIGPGKRRRYEDNQDALLRNFLWDGENIARQTDVNNATNRRYTLNPQVYGGLISQDGPAFHHGVYPERSRGDALGSTRNLTDSSQTVTDTRDHRAFGQTNASSGTNPNRFLWVGKDGYYQQPDPGNFWLRARTYNPSNGRFLSRDPAAAEVNRYRWPGDNPIMIIDPSGMQGRCGQPGHVWPHQQQRRGGEGLLVAAATATGAGRGPGPRAGAGAGASPFQAETAAAGRPPGAHHQGPDRQ